MDQCDPSSAFQGVKIAGCSVPMRTMWAGSAFQHHGQCPSRPTVSARNVPFPWLIRTVQRNSVWTRVPLSVSERLTHPYKAYTARRATAILSFRFAQEPFIHLGFLCDAFCCSFFMTRWHSLKNSVNSVENHHHITTCRKCWLFGLRDVKRKGLKMRGRILSRCRGASIS